MKTATGPPLIDPPSSVDTSKVNVVPSSFGALRTTTASATCPAPAPSTDTVAFGGSLAKLSLPSSHCWRNCRVVSCPAARVGRSANTIVFGETPVRTSLPFSSLAPAALRTASEGPGGRGRLARSPSAAARAAPGLPVAPTRRRGELQGRPLRRPRSNASTCVLLLISLDPWPICSTRPPIA